MPSVFPGVDPYLESQGFWSDFHSTFMNYWREAIAEVIPDNYEARIEESIRLVEVQVEESSKLVGADIALERRGEAGTATALLPAPAGAAILEAVTIPLPEVIEQRERHIRILRRPARSLVAILELFSPSNKEEPGYTLYQAKRRAILRQPVHLVELDLLQEGRRPRLAKDYPQGDYCAIIAHADRRPDVSVYSWGIRQRLPALPIPLTEPDAAVWVDLAAVFTMAFDRARFAKAIDYTIAPSAINPADHDWATQLARPSTSTPA